MIEGQMSTFYCDTNDDTYPEPNITWTLDGEKLPDSNTSLLKLVLRREQHLKLLRCAAINIANRGIITSHHVVIVVQCVFNV